MSSRDKRIGILIIILITVLISLAFWMYRPSYNWYSHSFEDDVDEPYGGDLTKAYFQSLRDADAFHVSDSSLDLSLKKLKGSRGANYIIYGYTPYLDSASTVDLLNFVEAGNSVFILSAYQQPDFLSSLHGSECLYYDEEPYTNEGLSRNTVDIESVDLRFSDPLLQDKDPHHFDHMVKDEKRSYEWTFLSPDYFCENNTSLAKLGTLNGEVNYARVRREEGYIYLHTNPKVFSNYYLVNDNGRQYADRAMAYLMPGDIYWDSKQWLSVQSDRQYNKDRYHPEEGPLTFLLSQESFRWALALIFIGVLSFLIVGTRRKQRVVPIYEPKENSSLQYVETLTGLYFAQRSDGRIFRFLSEQFLLFVRERYKVSVKWGEDEHWSLLAKASGVDKKELQKLQTMQIKGAYEPNVTGPVLAEFYQQLEAFYSVCK